MTSRRMKKHPRAPLRSYAELVRELVGLLHSARRVSAVAVNTILTSTYWQVGKMIIEHEQQGRRRAGYGQSLLGKLSRDLTERFGRGFSRQNLQRMRLFYLDHPPEIISQAPTAKSRLGPREICPTVSGKLLGGSLPPAWVEPTLEKALPLPWSHYTRLQQVRSLEACVFYEIEALRGGWSVRQLDRQIESRAGELDPKGREPSGGPHSLRAKGRSCRALCSRRSAQQDTGRRVPTRPS